MPENFEEIIFSDSHCRREDALKMGELDKEVRLNLRNKPIVDRLITGFSAAERVGDLGPDLQNILRQSYDYLTIMPKLRSTYDGCLIYKTSYNKWKAFHR